MPALTTGISNIESAYARRDTWAYADLAPFRSLLLRVRCNDSRYDQKIGAVMWWNKNFPDQDVPHCSSTLEYHLDIVAWEQSAGNQVPCRALQNTVKWFQLWTALAACFLILLI